MSRKKGGTTTRWPADSVERWSVDRLTPYDRNARRHSDEQVAQIAASIEQFGFTIPVLVDEAGLIIAGHGRVMAAKLLNLPEVPVMVARGWSEDQRRAYTLADNQLTLNGEWDEDLLRIELGDLKDDGFDLGVVGFSEKEIASILDGWTSDIDKIEKHGTHTDGITATIKIEVSRDDADAATKAVSNALSAANLAFSIK